MVIGVGNKLRLATVRNDLLPNHQKFQKFQKLKSGILIHKNWKKHFVVRSRAQKSVEFSHDIIITKKRDKSLHSIAST